jgi:putative DNA primase/helicase
VAVAFNAGNLLPVCQALRAKYTAWRLVIVADDDHATPGNPGMSKATAAARAVGGLLAVPDFGGAERTSKDTDANDLARLSGMEAVRLCIGRAASPISEQPPAQENTTGGKSDSESEETERPLLFDETRTPDIPPELLPSWLGEFAAAVARNTQTPPAMAVLLGLASVATAVAKRFDVAPHDGGYCEPLNIWTATALPPGSRKTAVVSAMTGPLIEWEKAEAERLAPEIRRVAAKRHAMEKRKEKLAKDAANADSQERLEEILQKIERLEGEIPEELRAPRLWTGDTTPERLQSLLVDHGERMAVLTDEGGIFEVMAGLYSGGAANLDIFLQGHAGHAVRVDRQGRAAHIDAPALTFGLAIQPEILAELASGGKRRFRGNGTLARFLFAVPRSNIGTRDVRAVYHIPAAVAKRYRDGLFDLLAIPPQTGEGREISRRLTLTPEALDSWQAFAEMIERRQGEDGDLEPIQDWSGKLPGAALRIAGGFHLAEHGSKPPARIEAATVERALDLCALLIEHARAAFGMMESESATADAKAIFRWIIEERLCRFRKGMAYRQFKGRFTGKPERLEKALQELEERAIISSAGKEKTRGRAAAVFIVNPALWKDQK